MNHRGRGEEVKPMNKSGDGNRGEKKMLKRTFMGGQGQLNMQECCLPI